MTDIPGLSQAEVEDRRRAGKQNFPPKQNTRTNARIVLHHLLDIPNLIILVSVFFLSVYGQVQDALMVSLIVMSNIILSVGQELQAKSSLERIKVINSAKVKVRRGDELAEVNPEELVQDDIIVATSGENLFVDGEVLVAENLLIDESILTGESDYAKREQGDQVMSGSLIVAGKLIYRATKVGDESYVNKITISARKYVNYLSPLQVIISRIAQVLTLITIVLIALLFTANLLYLNRPQVEIVEAVVAVISSTVPQGIVITLTLAFLVGVLRMYRQQILVQKANSVETLAGIKVLCMDKTGTLTENKLHVASQKWFEDEVRGQQLTRLYTSQTSEKNKTILSLAESVAGQHNYDSEPMTKLKVIRQILFTSRTKFSGVEFDGLQLVLGPVEVVSEYLLQEQVAQIKQIEADYANKGYRNVILAQRQISPDLQKDADQEAGQEAKLDDLGFSSTKEKFAAVAVFGLEDNLRTGANEIIQQFIEQGTKPIVISGDGPRTLQTLLRQLDIPQLTRVTTGAELAAADTQAEFAELVLGNDVFARVTPEQKRDIVSEFQNAFGRVAMIGDGVNDALAIKQANLGISLASGSNATKNISDVILLDDDLAKLSSVIDQGREIIYNTLRAAKLFIIKNIYSLIVIVGSILLGLTFPLNIRGQFVLGFLNANLPIIIILLESARPKQDYKFATELFRFVIPGGVLAGFLALGFSIVYSPQLSTRGLQTAVQSFFIFCGVVNSLIVLNGTFRLDRAIFGSLKSLAVLISIIGYAAMILYEPVRNFFEFELLPLEIWTVLVALTIGYFLLFSLIGSQITPRLKIALPKQLEGN